jgi:hypothetical protein
MATDVSLELPARSFVLEGVPFAVYRELRVIRKCRHVRMTYLDGSLVLTSPEFLHELGAEHLALIVRAVALAGRLKLCGVGRTTLWRDGHSHEKGSGKEADAAFYIGERVSAPRGKDSPTWPTIRHQTWQSRSITRRTLSKRCPSMPGWQSRRSGASTFANTASGWAASGATSMKPSNGVSASQR